MRSQTSFRSDTSAAQRKSQMLEVLLLEDSPTDALLVEQQLRDAGAAHVHLTTVTRLTDALLKLNGQSFDAALVDLNLIDSFGIDTFEALHLAAPDLPMIVLSGIEDAELTLKVLRGGAQDCLLKREVFGALLGRSIQFAIERQRIAAELDYRARELHQSETRIRSIIESSADAFVIVDEQGLVTYANGAAAHMFGSHDNVLCGKPLDVSVMTGEPVEVEIRRGDGSMGVAEMRSIGHVWGGGRHGNVIPIAADQRVAPAASSMLLSLRDITDRRHAENAIRSSEHRMRALIEHSSDGIYVADENNRLIYASPSVCALTGYSMTELLGMDVSEYVHADDIDKLSEVVSQLLLQPNQSVAVQWRFLHKSGGYLWFDAVMTNLSNDPTVGGIVSNFRDVTDRVRAEEAQRQSQKMEALGTLAGGIAHDFNNLLLAISGNTRLAIDDLPADHPVQRCLGEIEKASARASDLVRRILTFGRRGPQQRQVVELGGVVSEVVQLLRATLPATIEVQSHIAADIPHVFADSTQVHQVVLNLATNAAHAIAEGSIVGEVSRNGRGCIQIAVDEVVLDGEAAVSFGTIVAGKYVCISVIDNGCGIEPDITARIFEPFFTTKSQHRGTGLGLSMVHGIMQAHDGAIGVDSERSKGAAFRLYFPIAVTQPKPVVKALAVAPSGNGQSILYVDDEEALVMLAQRVLKRLGYEVNGFTDPAAALEEYKNHPEKYSAVVTDLSMIGMSGFQLAQGLRAVNPAVPIVLTSGYIRAEDSAAATRLGINELILKPDTVDALGQTLHRCLQAQSLKNSGQLSNAAAH